LPSLYILEVTCFIKKIQWWYGKKFRHPQL
jgi:hypothetical protein